MRASPNGLPVREAGIVALLAVAIFALLAVFSYSPSDDALTTSGAGASVANLVGASGAVTADVLLLLFGVCAYGLPLCLMLATVPILRRSALWSWQRVAIRAGGFVAMLIALCVLAELHIGTVPELPGDVRAGGVLGAVVVGSALPLLAWPGVTLFSLAVLMIGSQAAFGYSWLSIAERIGFVLHRGAAGCGSLILRICRSALARSRAWAQRRVRQVPVLDDAVHAEPPAPPPAPPPALPAQRPPPAVRMPPVAVRRRFSEVGADAEFPSLELLEDPDAMGVGGYSAESLERMSRLLEVKLADFKVQAQVVSVQPGPVVTRFELQPAAGVKVSKISGLAKDLARSLAVVSVRIVEIIPGKSVVGIEIPNEVRETVRLKEALCSDTFQKAASPLTLALGKDIAGAPVMADIGRMPHLLVAGTTGSGKSVGINAMLLSMLYKASPRELRLILVDPKMLELAVYDGIPHLLTPVVTDMKDAAQALNWCVAEMERRYKLMAGLGVRNLAGYNRRIDEKRDSEQPLLDPLWPEDAGEPAPPLERLPLIVVVIDEFADMMMIVGKKVEQLIARIAQKARAAGIHLVLATQRPSVDVITGLIKANVPARISFQVSSRIDSRTILDQGGAEQLLGHGDMLLLPPGTSMPVRVHGAFVSDDEVHAVAADWKARGAPDYVPEILDGAADADVPGTIDLGDGDAESEEPLYDEAVAYVLESRRASISSVQRKLRIGYNRAARLIEAMEAAGVVTAMNSNGTREVIPPPP